MGSQTLRGSASPIGPKEVHELFDRCNPLIETYTKYGRALELILEQNPRRFLDMGCSGGAFLQLVTSAVPEVDARGLDFSPTAVRAAKELGLKVEELDIDRSVIPFPDEYFDVIFCGELIEHVYDTDHLLTELRRVLSNKGVLILTTPNLASWFNRLLLAFGYQPFFTEVSPRHSVGLPLSLELHSGHLRVFVLRSLLELVQLNGFSVKSVMGFGINPSIGIGKRWSPVIKVVNTALKPFPSLSSDLMLLVEKTT